MISDFMHLNVPDERLVDQDRRKHRRKRRQSSDRSTLKQSSAFTRAPTFTFTRAALRLCVNGLCSPSAARQLDLDWRNHPCSRHRLPYSLFLIHTNALSIYLSFSFFLSLSLSLSASGVSWKDQEITSYWRIESNVDEGVRWFIVTRIHWRNDRSSNVC